MNGRQLTTLVCAALLVLPCLAQAEIYKWKDKDGTVRYSDTPPPSNIKQESISGKKSVKATGNAPLSPVATPQAKAAPAPAAAKQPAAEPSPGMSPEDEAAEKRQQEAEAAKKSKEEKEAQAKVKEENCKTAKANREAYVQGGRVYRMNEKGEREYMGDKQLKEGAAKAEEEINANCN